MSSSSKPSDPRNAWRWMRQVMRVTPGWILSLSHLLAAVLVRLSHRVWRNDVPHYFGLYLMTGGANADLYLMRVRGALELLSVYAPVHLRWLRSTFQVIMVDQVLRIMKDGLRPDYLARMLGLNPYTVWQSSTEQLALYLIGQATRGRLGRRFRRTRVGRTRGSRRVLREMIASAKVLPGGAVLVAEWESRLREFEGRTA